MAFVEILTLRVTDGLNRSMSLSILCLADSSSFNGDADKVGCRGDKCGDEEKGSGAGRLVEGTGVFDVVVVIKDGKLEDTEDGL